MAGSREPQGGALARARRRAGLSQIAAAELIGVPPMAWSRWERGVYRPRVGYRAVLAMFRRRLRSRAGGIARRGGQRPGAGRKRTYPGGTVWVRVPLPADFAQGLEPGSAPLRDEVIRIVRSARPGLGWE